MSNPTALTPDDAEHDRVVLRELVDLGVQLARDIAAEARHPGVATGHAAPFERIVRTVRRTILLAQRLEAGPTRTQRRTEARQRILREVEDSILNQSAGTQARALQAELRERLDAPDLEDAIGNRPIGEIICEIRRDLGLDVMPAPHTKRRRTPAQIAHLHRVAAAAPGKAAEIPIPGPDFGPTARPTARQSAQRAPPPALDLLRQR